MSSFEPIYEIIRKIPHGRVATYGQIAFIAGKPQGARLVSWALSSLKSGSNVPWWRVVNRKGEISFPENSENYFSQRTRLLEEGVIFGINGCIDLDEYGWRSN